MTAIKGTFIGAILTWVVSVVLATGGTSGGFLNIHTMQIFSVGVHWSWPLFIASSVIAAALVAMMN